MTTLENRIAEAGQIQSDTNGTLESNSPRGAFHGSVKAK